MAQKMQIVDVLNFVFLWELAHSVAEGAEKRSNTPACFAVINIFETWQSVLIFKLLINSIKRNNVKFL